MEIPATHQVGRHLSSRNALVDVRQRVIHCERCPRLVRYREGVASRKRREFVDWTYWGRPVPGFGDPNSLFMIVGLAPAAHSGNRTGRVFTGDRSGDFLYKSLYRVGLANQATSESVDDGLRLDRVYVTAAVKCAPPDNKPTTQETLACSNYLSDEIGSLKSLRAILCLGQFAFNSVLRAVRTNYGINHVSSKFGHGRILDLGQTVPTIFCSFHPSPRNTQTGKLTEPMFLSVLRKILKRIDAS